MKKIDVAIVNWSSGTQLLEVLQSIDNFGMDDVASVAIVDNASTDNSLELAVDRQSWQFPVHVVRNSDNRGFGAACNQAVKEGHEEYILFLNPDARLFEGSLAAAADFMERKENDGVAVVGIQLIDEAGSVSRSCARFPSLWMFFAMALGLNRLPWLRSYSHHMTDWDHAATREVDHVIGAFYLIRRRTFESIGGFDERFFVYLEDLDLSLRVKKSGGRIFYLGDVQAFHAGGGTSRQIKATRLFYSLRSRLLYGFKHFSLPAAWGLVGVTLLIEPVSRVFFALLRGGGEDVRNTLKGYGMLWRALPGILRGQGR